jgi:hypothetical protein
MFTENDFRAILDAMPAMVMVVDEDIRVLDSNRAAADMLVEGQLGSHLRRAGDAMLCIHSTKHPKGCGHSDACRHCCVRNSVAEALAGTAVVRRRARLEYHRENGTQEVWALVSATAIEFGGRRRALLVIDNISDLTDVQSFLPICSVCKKIRPEKDRWMPLESYFKNYWDVDFSHSYCPDCMEVEREKMLREFEATCTCGSAHIEGTHTPR